MSLVSRLVAQPVYSTSIMLMLFLLGACSSSEAPLKEEQARVDYDLLYTTPQAPLDYAEQVQPVLEQRCVVCHGCYDAPCQLKLSATEGISRGASKERVYDGGRIKAADPTRLFIDAHTTAQWREKGFYPVVNENAADITSPAERLENSVMYRMLRLKQLHPQPLAGMLPASLDVELNREQSCPKLDEFEDYAAGKPLQGMPFALPNLDSDEYATLVHWLAQGAHMPQDSEPSAEVLPQLQKWEAFLNGASMKQQLVSRYIYEHLFQAHLHFDGSDDREFYSMVRSTTPPGEAIDVIHTVRPYGAPEGKVYYRLRRLQGSIVAKNHVVYSFSEQRMKRYHELFFEPDYQVDSLPGYEPALASNPIKTFASLPLDSRYRFLLDDSRFFIEGFIKGPVCRGQIALNVIEDQFWVLFFDPDTPLASKNPAFLNAMADYLATPAELENNLKLITGRKHYLKLHQQYIKARTEFQPDIENIDLPEAMGYLWDGGGRNPNAALTVFRHYDSASVSFGLVGDFPETAWVIDYPLLERIHYLLVASFDVYGNVGHQFNTRLYMDFLRMEGEDYFLAFLPADQRRLIRDSWYSGYRSGMEKEDLPSDWIDQNYVTGYQTAMPQRELYQSIESYLGPLAGGGDYINRCYDDSCPAPDASEAVLSVDRAMRRAVGLAGEEVQYLPDVAMLRVRMGGDPADDLGYSMISNKAYKSVSSMFAKEKLGDPRDYTHDTQTVVRKILGSYPQFFYDISLQDVETFVDRYTQLHSREDYEKFVLRYGLRRTNPRFWEVSDWFNDHYLRTEPLEAGILDLNRYQDR